MVMTRRREDRIPTIPGLIAHIQTVAEREKAVLAREIHDELGGLLVAASMDSAWLAEHVSSQSDEVARRLGRLRETLASAVDLKRKIIEELRPTLLDNVGLFAALRWLVNNSCAGSGRAWTVNFQQPEPSLNPDASIAFFRIAQEGLAVVMEFAWMRSVELRLERAGSRLELSITGTGPSAPPEADPIKESYGLASIRHRTAALGGGADLVSSAAKITLVAWIPVGSDGDIEHA